MICQHCGRPVRARWTLSPRCRRRDQAACRRIVMNRRLGFA